MRKLLVLPALLLLAACSEETDKRGLEVLPDMFHTPAYKSQTAGSIEVDARDAKGQPIRREVQYPGMMTPPEGTVPRDGEAYPLAAGDFVAARALVNPVPATAAVLRQGQHDFLIFCATCHGRDGDASHGYVAKQFSGIPSLNGPAILEKPDGEIYHIITMGRARMYNLRAQLPPERRWAVVDFIKVQARAATAEADLQKLLPGIDEQLAKCEGDPDPVLVRRRAAIVALAAQAKADLAAVETAGDGHAFAPAPAAVPEYVGPTWPLPQEDHQ